MFSHVKCYLPLPTSLVDHDARPSISVNIRRSLEEYLKDASAEGGLPETIQKLQSDCGIKLTMTGKDDTDSLGCFVQYRIAFYVAGGLGLFGTDHGYGCMSMTC